MKINIKKLIVFFVLISIFATNVSALTINNIENDEGTITVTGKTQDGYDMYSVQLFCGEYDENAPFDNLISVDQGRSDADGNFNKTINIPNYSDSETYTIRCSDTKGELSASVIADYSVNLGISQVGHIFFDPSLIKMNCGITSSVNNDMYIDIDVNIYKEGEDDILTTKTLKNVLVPKDNKNCEINVDLSDNAIRYGMFEANLSVRLSGSNECKSSDKVRFSVVKQAQELNSKVGVHTQFGAGYANPKISAELMDKAGFGGIRDYIDKVQCYPNGTWITPERYNGWKSYFADKKQVIMLDDWTGGTHKFPKTDAELTEFSNYAKAVAQHTVADGVYYYELFNEPNWSVATAEEYANMVVSVAPALHSVNSDIKVVIGAVAGVDNFHAVNYVVGVLNNIKNKGVDPHNYIDVISVHPYKPLNQYPEKADRTDDSTYGTESYPELTALQKSLGQTHPDPTDTIKGDSSLNARMQNMKNRLEQIDCDDIPVIATEIGWYSYEGISGQTTDEEAKYLTDLTELGQAQYSVRSVALLYNYLDEIYFHTLCNKPNNTTPMEINFGLLENWTSEIPYEAKPAFVALANCNAMIANAECISENKNSDNVYDYLFERPDGSRCHMIWVGTETGKGTDENVTYSLKNSTKLIKITDIYGNESLRADGNGNYTLTASGSPIYVDEVDNLVRIDLLNQNINVITKLNENITAVAARLRNYGGNLINNGYLVCASYKDGKLIDFKMTKTVNTKAEMATAFVSTSGVDEIRAFYWNENYKPLIPFVEAK